MHEIFSKEKQKPEKAPEESHWSYSSVFIVNFEQISQIPLMFSLLFLNK